MELADFWRGRRVFLTGHTGFKGAWLNLWLEKLGAITSAAALAPDTNPSLYKRLAPWRGAHHHVQDIRAGSGLCEILRAAAPEVVIHMAAQALVRRSYVDPVATYETNVMGTVNLLEAVRACPSVKTVLVITSDKVYANDDRGAAFEEDDPLGGKDPYSASKACTEIVCHSYRASFFEEHGIRLATARAGNVIGGGDWSSDRLIPDIVRAFERDEPIALRYPNAIRPWQHVLEPLGGYLMYAQALSERPERTVPPALNFGPDDAGVATVSDIAETLAKSRNVEQAWMQAPGAHPKEAAVLKLNSALAETSLGWSPKLTLHEAIDWTAAWYDADRAGEDMRALSLAQIDDYEKRIRLATDNTATAI